MTGWWFRIAAGKCQWCTWRRPAQRHCLSSIRGAATSLGGNKMAKTWLAPLSDQRMITDGKGDIVIERPRRTGALEASIGEHNLHASGPA